MRCPKCDVAIPIGGEMCTKCGYNVRTMKTDPRWNPPDPIPPDPIPPDPVPPKPGPKPKKPSWIRRFFRKFLILLVACLIGRFIGWTAGNLWAKIELGDISFPKVAVQKAADPAFENYLTQRGLSYTPKLKKSECIIIELEGGYFSVNEYGYSGDRVTEYYETIYLSMDGCTASEAELFKSNARTIFGALLNPTYASMEEDIQGNCFVLRIHYRDLTDQDVISALINDGFVTPSSLQGDKVRYISMKETLRAHLAGGAIQR